MQGIEVEMQVKTQWGCMSTARRRQGRAWVVMVEVLPPHRRTRTGQIGGSGCTELDLSKLD